MEHFNQSPPGHKMEKQLSSIQFHFKTITIAISSNQLLTSQCSVIVSSFKLFSITFELRCAIVVKKDKELSQEINRYSKHRWEINASIYMSVSREINWK